MKTCKDSFYLFFYIFNFCLFINTEAFSAELDNSVKTQSETEQEYYFDSSLFEGTGLSKSFIDKLSRSDLIEPNTYKVDVYLNNKFLVTEGVLFENVEGSQGVLPCLDQKLVDSFQLIEATEQKYENLRLNAVPHTKSCITLNQIVEGTNSNFDFANLRLNFSIPQAFLQKVPRGYVNPNDLDAGESIAFVNYIGNYYYTKNKESDESKSTYLNLNGGINFGKWQYRQLSNFITDNNGNSSWNNIRSYVQRPIPQWYSQFTLGQQYTSGQFFSGMSFEGFNLSTDERMRPESLRGYAPMIRGVAQTNARVSILQNGREIYQTSVSPGPFEISDLYPMSYGGNLTMIVYEADGTKSSVEVPYAALPESLRAGMTNYSFSLGRTNQDYGLKSYFGDLNYEYGLNNLVTVNSGVRIAENYQAIAAGGVLGGKYGAFGVNLTYSNAKIPNETTSGWMADLSYSKTLQPTNTTLSLASYHYSSIGYRNLNDVLSIRKYWQDSQIESTYNAQRAKFQLSISQPFGDYGSMYFTGSTQSYRDGRESDTTLQVGYNKTFGMLSMSLNYTRQKISTFNGTSIEEESFDNFGGISLNMPLGKTKTYKTPYLNANYNGSNRNDNYQVGVTGAFDEDYSLNYNVGMTGMSQVSQPTYNVGLNKKMSSMLVGLNTSYSDQYKQGSVSTSGAVAIHSGGVTFGQYIGDTFALIEAKGATGAKLVNSPISKIDRFGYAILPSISPYRYNDLAIDPAGMSGNVEVEGGEQRVAPILGAAVKVKFKTRFGYSVLIQTHLLNGKVLPIGADVMTDTGEIIGMVGQNGQIYARVEQLEGQLAIRWGNEPAQQCQINYHLEQQQIQQQLIKLNSTCVVGE